MLSEHFPGGKAHDAAPHRGEHSELEASEGDGRGAQAGGHKQGGGDGHLAGVLRVIIQLFRLLFIIYYLDYSDQKPVRIEASEEVSQ